MNPKFLHLAIIVISILLVVGCSNNLVETNNGQNEEIKKVAWGFIEDKGWNYSTKGNWKGAEVTQTAIDNRYVLLDNDYEGKEVFLVSFEDKEKGVVGTPLILVDPTTKEVIGYMPGE